ncbi:MAG: UvrD-helicase domain-containing protein [Pseudomonadota bacterium]
MSRRSNSPDTNADREIQACIQAAPPQPFVVRAGAGSGKTTSLIKALDRVISSHGAVMRLKKQQVACITYTDLAANEIRADVNESPLVHVSTIHSFYWEIAKTFQADIRTWLTGAIQLRIGELVEKARNFGPRVREATRENNAKDQQRYASHLAAITKVSTFSYGVGSDYQKGILGHEDILRLADYLLQERPLFRRLVALKFPFVFIDESQDTFESVVESFKRVEQQMRGQFCLGFFGDPMQKIFMRGIGDIALADHWRSITKPENFRCAQRILAVANAVRAKGDGLTQVRGLHEEVDGQLKPVEGSARMFVLPNSMDRKQALADIRTWSAASNSDPGWTSPDLAVKILVIVHRIAAKRLGFGSIYAALNDRAPESIKQGMQDGTGWPLRPFLGFVLPLVAAMKAGNEFEAMNILRAQCPRLQPASISRPGAAAVLRETRQAVQKLTEMLEGETATIRDIAVLLRDEKLLALEERFDRVLGLVVEPRDANMDPATQLQPWDAPVTAFLSCPAHELWPYQRYVSEGSPFATQQGVKGAQFDRVIVVMDEEESDYNLYDYEELFGIKEISADDRKKMENGEDTGWNRTLRLLYVSCTRAKRGLVLAFFVHDPEAAVAHVLASGILPNDAVLTCSDLKGG